MLWSIIIQGDHKVSGLLMIRIEKVKVNIQTVRLAYCKVLQYRVIKNSLYI